MERDMKELPIGFTMSLAMNEKAMKSFSDMSEEQRKSIEEESRNVKLKVEMERLVDRIGQEMR